MSVLLFALLTLAMNAADAQQVELDPDAGITIGVQSEFLQEPERTQEIGILGDLFVEPGGVTAAIVRKRLAPVDTDAAPRLVVDQGTRKKHLQRPLCDDSINNTTKDTDYWRKRTSPPTVEQELLGAHNGANIDAHTTVSGSGTPDNWCVAQRPATSYFEPVARALWGPLLLVVFASVIFWVTRGFRSA